MKIKLLLAARNWHAKAWCKNLKEGQPCMESWMCKDGSCVDDNGIQLGHPGHKKNLKVYRCRKT